LALAVELMCVGRGLAGTVMRISTGAGVLTFLSLERRYVRTASAVITRPRKATRSATPTHTVAACADESARYRRQDVPSERACHAPRVSNHQRTKVCHSRETPAPRNDDEQRGQTPLLHSHVRTHTHTQTHTTRRAVVLGIAGGNRTNPPASTASTTGGTFSKTTGIHVTPSSKIAKLNIQLHTSTTRPEPIEAETQPRETLGSTDSASTPGTTSRTAGVPADAVRAPQAGQANAQELTACADDSS
jgi:hypothetical protein